MIRIQCTVTEFVKSLRIKQRTEVFIIHDLDLLNLMRRAEAVEEVDERNAPLDGNEMCNRREIHDFLNTCFSEHSAACLTASHDVLMVAKDVQGVRCKRTSTDVEDARKKLTGNLVEVRDHQKKTLRSRVRRRERTGLQRAMHSTSCTGF